MRFERKSCGSITDLQKSSLLEFFIVFWLFQLFPLFLRMVEAIAISTAPSTRAGGLDDGSYKNSLKQDGFDQIDCKCYVAPSRVWQYIEHYISVYAD